jgi:hypothetical protein
MPGRRAATEADATRALAQRCCTEPNGRGLGAKGPAGSQTQAGTMAALCPLQPVLGAGARQPRVENPYGRVSDRKYDKVAELVLAIVKPPGNEQSCDVTGECRKPGFHPHTPPCKKVEPNGRGLGAWGRWCSELCEIIDAPRPLQPVLGAAPVRPKTEPLPRARGDGSLAGGPRRMLKPRTPSRSRDERRLTAKVQGQTAGPNQKQERKPGCLSPATSVRCGTRAAEDGTKARPHATTETGPAGRRLGNGSYACPVTHATTGA